MLKYGFLLRHITLSLLLIMPVLCFTLPLVTLGTENLRMISHFDIDEAVLIEFGAKTYSQGIIPLEFQASYPQFFYYVAGIVLFPFTFFRGIDHQTIVIILRSFNILIGIITAFFLYYFFLKFFRSVLAAALSSLFFITTPDYLIWLVNSRPHPLEIFFILVTFYFCFRIIEEYRPRFIWGAVIAAGFATATKLGGLFMIPIIWAAYIYHSAQLPTSELVDYSKKKKKLIYLISFLLVCAAICVPLAIVFLYLKFPAKFYFMKIRSFDDFLNWRNFRLILLMAYFLSAGAVIWLAINFFAKRFSKDRHLAQSFRYLFLINRAILFLFFLFLSNIFLYILLNPSYFLYPLHTAKIMGEHLLMSTMTSGLDPGLKKPILDLTGLLWFRKLFFENLVFNGWFGLLFLGYLIHEISNFKRNWSNSRDFIFQRLLLSLYSISLFLVLFLFLAHQTHHYLLPIAMAIGILISFAIVGIPRRIKNRFFKYFCVLLLISVLILGFYTRLTSIVYLYGTAIAKKTIPDTGVLIGNWLENRYDPKVKIWKDCPMFFIPEKFKNIFFMDTAGSIENELDALKRIDPEVIIITSRSDPSLENARKFALAVREEKIKGYRLEKEFAYGGSLAMTGVYKKIAVYAKVRDR